MLLFKERLWFFFGEGYDSFGEKAMFLLGGKLCFFWGEGYASFGGKATFRFWKLNFEQRRIVSGILTKLCVEVVDHYNFLFAKGWNRARRACADYWGIRKELLDKWVTKLKKKPSLSKNSKYVGSPGRTPNPYYSLIDSKVVEIINVYRNVRNQNVTPQLVCCWWGKDHNHFMQNSSDEEYEKYDQYVSVPYEIRNGKTTQFQKRNNLEYYSTYTETCDLNESLSKQKRTIYIQNKSKIIVQQTKRIADFWYENQDQLYEIEKDFLSLSEIKNIDSLINQIKTKYSDNMWEEFWQYLLDYKIYRGKYKEKDFKIPDNITTKKKEYEKNMLNSLLQKEKTILNSLDILQNVYADVFKDWYERLLELCEYRHSQCDETGIEFGIVDNGKSLDFKGTSIRNVLVSTNPKARMSGCFGGWSRQPFVTFLISNLAQSSIHKILDENPELVKDGLLIVSNKTAWQNVEFFSLFLKECVIPGKPKGPVFLHLDSLAAHFDKYIKDLCKEHDIFLVPTLSKQTHYTAGADLYDGYLNVAKNGKETGVRTLIKTWYLSHGIDNLNDKKQLKPIPLLELIKIIEIAKKEHITSSRLQKCAFKVGQYSLTPWLSNSEYLSTPLKKSLLTHCDESILFVNLEDVEKEMKNQLDKINKARENAKTWSCPDCNETKTVHMANKPVNLNGQNLKKSDYDTVRQYKTPKSYINLYISKDDTKTIYPRWKDHHLQHCVVRNQKTATPSSILQSKIDKNTMEIEKWKQENKDLNKTHLCIYSECDKTYSINNKSGYILHLHNCVHHDKEIKLKHFLEKAQKKRNNMFK